MLMHQDKIGEKNRQIVDEITKNLTNVLSRIEDSNPQLKKDLANLKIEQTKEIAVNDKRCYLVRVNESAVKNLHNVHSEIVQKLEEHFSTPVIIVPLRSKIDGKLYRKYRGTKVPRDKTLTAIHDTYLEDLLYPATIVGKRVRYPKGSCRVFKVFVDPLDREHVEYKTAAIAACYKSLTFRDLVIEFAQN
jgi:small subunit ribosomal protein S7e